MLTSFFFKQPRLLLILLGSIFVSGITSYILLPKMEDPVLRKRVGVVTTIFPGANANEVQLLVAEPLEAALEKISEIVSVNSNCRDGILNLVIELADRVNDVDRVWRKVERAIDAPGHAIPDGCDAPALHVFPLKAYASIISIESENTELEPSIHAAQWAKERLLRIDGTEDIQIFGDPGSEVKVAVSPDRLKQHGVSFGRFAQESGKVLTNGAVGEVVNGEIRARIGLKSSLDPLNQIRSHSFRNAFGKKVTIGDLADVRFGTLSDFVTRARINGHATIVLGVMVEGNCQIEHWSKELAETLTELRLKYPRLQIQELFSQHQQISDRMRLLVRNLALSTISVVLVVLFLMGWKSMVVVAAALPLTVLLVLTGMRLLAIPIHQISVTGIVVSLGLLIDNAIVVVDDVRKKIYAGEDPRLAIEQSIRHLRFPLLGATLTTAFSFLPIALLPGPAGEFVGSIAITVIMAVVASYLVATILLPSLIGWTIKSSDQPTALEYGIQYPAASEGYLTVLKRSCDRPWIAILVGSTVSILGFLLWKRLPVQFFPATDRQQIQIEVEKSNHSSMEGLERTVEKIESILGSREEVSGQHWFLGGSAPTFYYNVVPRYIRAPQYAQAFLNLESKKQKSNTAEYVVELQELLDDQISDARVTVRRLEQGPPFDAPIEVILVGPDQDELIEVGQQIRRVLVNTRGVIQTCSDLNATRVSYVFESDAKACSELSISESEIQKELRAAIYGVPLGAVLVDGQLIDVRVELDLDDQRPVSDELLDLPLSFNNFLRIRDVPDVPTFGWLGKFELQTARPTILRRNGENVNIIKGYIDATELSSAVMQRFQKNLSNSQLVLPEGYRIEIGGEEQKRNNAENSLFANAPLFALLVLFLMVAIFGSFRAAMSIALIGLLTIGMVPLALFWFSYPFGFMAVIGAMGLVGIAINDSIVVLAGLFSLNRLDRRCAQSVAQVVYDNTRHILATTATSVAGFLPLVLSGGEFWPPMAIAICAGIIGATLLALFFLPALFLILNSLSPFDHEESSPGRHQYTDSD